jgi:hypothetical protein
MMIQPTPLPAKRPLTLIRVPLLDGGRVRRVTLDGPTGAGPILGGGTLLWLDARNAPYDTVISRAGVRYEYPASDDLMASPLDGGPAWRVAHGIVVAASSIPLAVSEDGVFWKVPRPYPDRRRDLYFLSTGDVAAHRPPRMVPDFSGDQPPALFQGRLCWIERRTREDRALPDWLSWYSPSSYSGGSLVSARLDGTDRRVLLAEGQEPGLTLRRLWVDRTRDRLYVSGTVAVERPGSNVVHPVTFVDRVSPDGAGQLRGRLTLPETIIGEPEALDDGYVYLVYNASRRGLGAALSDLFSTQNTRTETPTLCRIRLPE